VPKRITAAEIQQFRFISSTKIEIELRDPIERSYFELYFDFAVTGASTVRAATVGGRPQTIMSITGPIPVDQSGRETP
jgi:hypothetical protein